MSFPTLWAQSWIRLPEAGNQFPCYLQWWRWSGDFTPDPFVWAIGANKFSDWFRFNLGQLVISDSIDQPSVHLYIYDGTTTHFYPSSFFGNLYPIGHCLPGFKTVVVRRIGGPDRSDSGHFNIHGVEPGFVENGALTPAALESYQALADATPLTLEHDGVTFTPITVSYKLATATDVTRLEVRPRLGLLRRRAHLHPGFLQPTTPKLPPL